MQMLELPYLGGTFNNTFLLGIQLYIWLFILIIAGLILSEIIWRVGFWSPITPFHGLWYAYKNKSNAAFVFDTRQYWDLVSEGGAKLIFDRSRYSFSAGLIPNTINLINIKSENHITFSEWFRNFRIWLFGTDYSVHTAKMLQGDWEEYPLVTIGKTPAELIFDANHWTDNKSKDREYIGQCVDMYNEGNPDDEIHSLSKFYKYSTLKPQPRISCPNVVLTVLIPWSRIDSAFPLKRFKAAWAGFLRQTAEDLANKSTQDINKFAILIFILGTLIVILMFVGKWLKLV